MKKLNVLFGLVTVLLFTAVVSAGSGPVPACCTWVSDNDGECAGPCDVTYPYCTFTPVGYDKNCTCLTSDTCRWDGQQCEGSCGEGYDCVPKFDKALPYCVCEDEDPPMDCDDCCKSKGYLEGSCYEGVDIQSTNTCPPGTVWGGADCDGYCSPLAQSMIRMHCCCIEKPTSVPEFATPAIALVILLTSPAFAYLVVKRKRH